MIRTECQDCGIKLATKQCPHCGKQLCEDCIKKHLTKK